MKFLVLFSVIFIFFASSANAQTSTATGSDVITTLFICGLMGLIGQGARVIIGLKTWADYKSSTKLPELDPALAVFSTARLVTSLIVGFVAGVVSGLASWKLLGNGVKAIDVTDIDTLIKFAAAGYIGTDVIEGFTTKYFEKSSGANEQSTSKSSPESTKAPFTAATSVDLSSVEKKIDNLSDNVTSLQSTIPASGLLSLASFESPAALQLLGSLSSKYEVGGRGPGTVSGGLGDPGGPSYGSYQMTSKPNGGTVRSFVATLPADKRRKFDSFTPGDGSFTAAWKALAQADASGFFSLQHKYIQDTHYLPVCRSVADTVDVSERSFALQNVVWSTAVQHGPATGIIATAIKGLDFASEVSSHELDRVIIRNVYLERGRRLPDGRLAHFTRASAQVQASVAARFVSEQRDALKMLDSETAAPNLAASSDEYAA